MSTAHFMFKCRACGTRFEGGATNGTNGLPFASEIIQGKTPLGLPLAICDIHRCFWPFPEPEPYTVYGVGDFISVEIREDPK
jgi:hypothetical protein